MEDEEGDDYDSLSSQREQEEAERIESEQETRDQDNTNPHYEEEEPERRICPDCNGTNLNYINPDDGGGCPSCCNGYV
jgi:hypothetical protein